MGALDGRAIGLTLVKVVASASVGSATALLLMRASEALASLPAGFLLQLGIAGLGGLAAAYVAMAVLKVPELSMVVGRLTRRLGKKRADS